VLLTTIFDLEEDEEADMKDSNISGLDFLGFFYKNIIYTENFFRLGTSV